MKLITNNPTLPRGTQRPTTGATRGIALYIAVTVTAVLVLVSFAIITLAIRSVSISDAGKNSQEAFYAADSGDECALFWDVKNPTHPGVSAFATATPQTIFCNADLNNPLNAVLVVGGGGQGNATSTFNLTFLPKPYCATVTVTKGYSGGNPTTKIESRGYNTCDNTSPERVERAIRVTY